jgi:hypothetical protein
MEPKLGPVHTKHTIDEGTSSGTVQRDDGRDCRVVLFLNTLDERFSFDDLLDFLESLLYICQSGFANRCKSQVLS